MPDDKKYLITNEEIDERLDDPSSNQLKKLPCSNGIHQNKISVGFLALILIVIVVATAMYLLIFNSIALKRSGSYNMAESSLSPIMHTMVALFNLKTAAAEKTIQNTEDSQVISCYYNFPGSNTKSLLPSALDPHLCTHINVGFAKVVNKEIILEEDKIKSISQLVELKSKNPNLKIILSVGGAGANNGFSDMVINHASRKVFIKSIKYILCNHSMDGIDLDWEFPAVHGNTNFLTNKIVSNNNRYQANKRERQHFSQLLREIRMEYIREKRPYILTAAVAAPEIIVNAAYDVDQMDLYLDYVNVMTYDYHFFTKYTPFTGLNSPLYPRRDEQLYLATLNMNYTAHLYMSKGLRASKIVLGIPTYGHSFTLYNANNKGVGSPASGYGKLGGLGFTSYPDVCAFVNNNTDVTITWDDDAKVPFLSAGREWVSYDNPRSVREKAMYIKKNGLRGAMMYSLNADDHSGLCRGQLGDGSHFPLVQTVRNAFTDKYDK